MANLTSSPSASLVDAHGLLAELFAPDARPSLRWLQRQLARKTIPFFRIGHFVRFDPVQVRQALEKNCLVVSKHSRAVTTAGGAS